MSPAFQGGIFYVLFLAVTATFLPKFAVKLKNVNFALSWVISRVMLDKFKGLLGKIPTGTLSGVTLALILWLTLAPHPAGNLQLPLFPGADKIIHGIMFGFLGIVILLEWMKKRNWKPLTLPDVAVVAFAVSALGVAIEFVQRAMGMGRTLEIYDMLADAAGAMIAAFGFSMVQTFLKNPDD